MSVETVKKMFETMQNDPDLLKNFAGLMSAHQLETQDVLAHKLIDFGRTVGFDFSADELRDALKTLFLKITADKELDESSLSKISGGDASGDMQKAMAEALGMAMKNALGAQHNSQMISSAAIAASTQKILGTP